MRILLLSPIFLIGCSTTSPTPDYGVPVDRNAELKPQMPIMVDGVEYIGTGTVLRTSSATIEPKLPKDTVLTVVSTCARRDEEFKFYDESENWTYEYVPATFVETSGGCPLSVIAVTKSGEWHRSLIDFTNAPTVPLKVDVMCNGRWDTHQDGAFLCSVAKGLPIRVVASEKAVIAKDPTEKGEHCDEPKPVLGTAKEWEIKAGKGACVYVMLNLADTKEFRLTTFGYTSFLKVFPPKEEE